MKLKRVRKSIDYNYLIDVITQGLIVRYEINFNFYDNSDEVCVDIFDYNIITNGIVNKELSNILLCSIDRTFRDVADKDLENQYDLDKIWKEIQLDANTFLNN